MREQLGQHEAMMCTHMSRQCPLQLDLLGAQLAAGEVRQCVRVLLTSTGYAGLAAPRPP